MNLDLDARRESLGIAPVVTFKGETFTLPVEMPFFFVEAWNDDMPIPQFAKLLLGEEQWKRFVALEPSSEEVKAVALHDYWGVPPGEGQASAGSSETNGDRSRPTSSASTESTSVGPSVKAKKRSASAG